LEITMNKRRLTITMQANWQGALGAAGKSAKANTYQGKGNLSVRELARALGRDVKRVHDDVVMLAEPGLLERTDNGVVICPFASMHTDMYRARRLERH
jgi:hypothetical protein